jgi:NAD(P)H dehydrogenase (quinone)
MLEQQIDMFMGMFVTSRNGEFAAVDPTLERLIGRPLIFVRELLSNEHSKGNK